MDPSSVKENQECLFMYKGCSNCASNCTFKHYSFVVTLDVLDLGLVSARKVVWERKRYEFVEEHGSFQLE